MGEKKKQVRVKYEGENTEENEATSLMSSDFLFPGFFHPLIPCFMLFFLLFLCFFFQSLRSDPMLLSMPINS